MGLWNLEKLRFQIKGSQTNWHPCVALFEKLGWPTKPFWNTLLIVVCLEVGDICSLTHSLCTECPKSAGHYSRYCFASKQSKVLDFMGLIFLREKIDNKWNSNEYGFQWWQKLWQKLEQWGCGGQKEGQLFEIRTVKGGYLGRSKILGKIRDQRQVEGKFPGQGTKKPQTGMCMSEAQCKL
jgi:hypothetical protein